MICMTFIFDRELSPEVRQKLIHDGMPQWILDIKDRYDEAKKNGELRRDD